MEVVVPAIMVIIGLLLGIRALSSRGAGKPAAVFESPPAADLPVNGHPAAPKSPAFFLSHPLAAVFYVLGLVWPLGGMLVAADLADNGAEKVAMIVGGILGGLFLLFMGFMVSAVEDIRRILRRLADEDR